MSCIWAASSPGGVPPLQRRLLCGLVRLLQHHFALARGLLRHLCLPDGGLSERRSHRLRASPGSPRRVLLGQLPYLLPLSSWHRSVVIDHGFVDGPVHRLLRFPLDGFGLLCQVLLLGERDDAIPVQSLALSIDLDFLEKLMQLGVAALGIVPRSVPRKVDALVGKPGLLSVVLSRCLGVPFLMLNEE